MTYTLRLMLLVICTITFLYVMRKIRKSQMQIEDSIYWIAFSVLLLILSIFPILGEIGSRLLGIISPVNFMFLFIIAILIFKVFSLSIKVSQLDNRLKQLSQYIALEKNEKDIKNSTKTDEE